MAHQIIKQPDGKLAVFDTSASLIVLWDATEEETVDWFAHRAAERERARATEKVRHVAAGDSHKVYFQFAMSWEEALDEDRQCCGDAWKAFKAS